MTDTNTVIRDIDDNIIETYPLRTGDTLACANDALYVVRDGEDTIRVSIDDIVELQYDDFDWFLGFVSLALVGFGLYSTSHDVLLGLGFAAAGSASFYLTYRKRGKITFQVSGRPKPLDVYPESGRPTYEAIGSLAGTGEER